ncbi:MAG: hypothetical protein ABIA78_04520 [archaeon]
MKTWIKGGLIGIGVVAILLRLYLWEGIILFCIPSFIIVSWI